MSCAFAEPETPAEAMGLFIAVVAAIGQQPIVLAQGSTIGQASL
jgi:hypothetical protein